MKPKNPVIVLGVKKHTALFLKIDTPLHGEMQVFQLLKSGLDRFFKFLAKKKWSQ